MGTSRRRWLLDARGFCGFALEIEKRIDVLEEKRKERWRRRRPVFIVSGTIDGGETETRARASDSSAEEA